MALGEQIVNGLQARFRAPGYRIALVNGPGFGKRYPITSLRLRRNPAGPGGVLLRIVRNFVRNDAVCTRHVHSGGEFTLLGEGAVQLHGLRHDLLFFTD